MNSNESTKTLTENLLSQEDALFGFFRINDFETHLKANKKGLESYAQQLLDAASRIEDSTSSLELDTEWLYEDADLYFDKIYVVNDRKQMTLDYVEPKLGIKERIQNFIFYAILSFILLSILIGIFTIASWFFDDIES